MTKQSKMLQLLTQIKREFNIGEPRFPHLKLKVSDMMQSNYISEPRIFSGTQTFLKGKLRILFLILVQQCS